MNKTPPFRICDTDVAAGSHALVEMPAAQLFTNTPLHIPIHVVHGRKPGPTLLVTAAVHGDELNGVEIIRRLLQHKSLSSLKGTLVAVPVVNVFGFIHKSRYLPDRRDLNRCFPGSGSGSLASRMAYLFRTQVLQHCNHAIDLHTGAIHRSNLPQIRAALSDENSAAMANAFGVPVILNSDLMDGTLRSVAQSLDIPVITYEAGEALRLDEASIRLGVRGVLNVIRHLGMLPASRKKPLVASPTVARSSQWVRANIDGLFRPLISLGERVKTGDVLGRISGPFADRDEVDLLSPCSGILVGRNNLPLVNEGEALFHIARFEEVTGVAEQLEELSSSILNGELMSGDEPPIAP